MMLDLDSEDLEMNGSGPRQRPGDEIATAETASDISQEDLEARELNQTKSKTTNQHDFKGSKDLTVPHHCGPHPTSGWRSNLVPYLTQPKSYPNEVIRETADTILIKDKYPKAKVHLLLLPKWEPHRDLHPHDAFTDAEFLAMMRTEVAIALPIAASRLTERILGSITNEINDHTVQNARLAIMEKMKQDYTKAFQVGIHAHPSQLHLHVHIISRDMESHSIQTIKHYTCCNTPFFVPLSDYPLSLDDIRRDVQYQNDNLNYTDCRCWKCGKYYGLNFPSLKLHLHKEWKKWKKEWTKDVLDISVQDETEV